ncbi:hypothetical protein IWX49DRAFT_595222 [Phyllosticta citricarpa]|uniref:Glycoside hydrolase family 125 protein n=2 Tax=Phyllosticta TaxID=121621 RepID=A0ABR1L626_9PEZI
MSFVLTLGLWAAVAVGQTCPDYNEYSQQRNHPPFSSGRYHLPSQRPIPACRTFNSSEVEDTLSRLKDKVSDPDLYRLFENTYPNTLDTAIKWKGVAANNSDEELTFVITGDINAMWLRDSANQMQSYLPLLKASDSSDSLASLFRGVINLQARYVNTSPFCNSFQPPPEARLPRKDGSNDNVFPKYSNDTVFECKYELDSLAAFLEVSDNYYNATQDSAFFERFQWLAAVRSALNVANAMMTPTYADDGKVNESPYSFTRQTDRASETLLNDGLGSPVLGGTGLIRSAFRPSDDSTIFQLFIPANMMFSRYLESAANIVAALQNPPGGLEEEMRDMAASLRRAISRYGIVDGSTGQIYAYEVDGYGSRNIMDDANIPSLLSAPFFGYLDENDEVYQNTRRLVLSSSNPYWAKGPVISSVGGPHVGPGKGWPMALIVRIFTSNDAQEITAAIQTLLSTTDGLGLIHESINAFNVSDWTRQWFSWVNGLFGQMIVDLEARKPEILSQSFQGSTERR